MKKQVRQRPRRPVYAVRLDAATRKRLDAAATAADSSTADVVREMLTQGLERLETGTEVVSNEQ